MFVYKIVYKIIVNHLLWLMDDLVGPIKRHSSKERLISDNIFLAAVLMHLKVETKAKKEKDSLVCFKIGKSEKPMIESTGTFCNSPLLR